MGSQTVSLEKTNLSLAILTSVHQRVSPRLVEQTPQTRHVNRVRFGHDSYVCAKQNDEDKVQEESIAVLFRRYLQQGRVVAEVAMSRPPCLNSSHQGRVRNIGAQYQILCGRAQEGTLLRGASRKDVKLVTAQNLEAKECIEN